MKQIVTVTEVEGEGLEGLLGHDVMLFCMNYIYSGKLVGVNSTFVKLANAEVVYETGEFGTGRGRIAQSPNKNAEWYIHTAAIESFGAK